MRRPPQGSTSRDLYRFQEAFACTNFPFGKPPAAGLAESCARTGNSTVWRWRGHYFRVSPTPVLEPDGSGLSGTLACALGAVAAEDAAIAAISCSHNPRTALL
mmetsp:Transcript_32426/g.85103  ORF Transcript_32426/g.85103 Transcript_32426/m.85103 type:complete len:103 (-) Transcript_32426:327-635(-)